MAKESILVEGEKFARKCSVTGEGMNEGYCFGDGEEYFKYEEDLIAYLRKNGNEEFNKASDEFILKESYDLEEYYYTTWEDEDDFQYIVRGGKLVDIEEEENTAKDNKSASLKSATINQQNMNKPITGYNAIIKFHTDNYEQEALIKVGSFDEDTATEQEILEDEKVFFYIDSPEEIETLKTNGIQDFIVLSYEPLYD